MIYPRALLHYMEEQNQPHTSPIAGEPASLKPGMVVPRGALMALRATLTLALNQADHSPTGYTLDESDALDTMTATVEQALIQVDTVLGLEEPTEDASEGLTHEDFQHDPYAGDAEGEMRAEAEAERRADAALELAAELASCDWEGWD